MNYKGAYRTAPATPGLLNISNFKTNLYISMFLFDHEIQRKYKLNVCLVAVLGWDDSIMNSKEK